LSGDLPRAFFEGKQFLLDVEAEGLPDKEFTPGFVNGIAAKTAASGAMIQDDLGRLLFVVPIYQDGLGIPGGISESNESPSITCLREIREELGLEISLGQLLVVDWMPQNGIWRDSIQFVFDGGVFGKDEIAKISTQEEEIEGFRFAHLEDVKQSLKPSLYRRLRLAREAKAAGTCFYSNFGRR
jgi:ADP-ribose pyrophosphatase YjhB (NUDIX family)